MTGNSITQSQGERSRTDQYPEEAEAEPDKRDSGSRLARFDPPARQFQRDSGSDWRTG